MGEDFPARAGVGWEGVELLEHYQWMEGDEVEEDKARKREAEFELVDVLYWVVTLADAYKIDLSETLKKKLERNRERYPAERFFAENRGNPRFFCLSTIRPDSFQTQYYSLVVIDG